VASAGVLLATGLDKSVASVDVGFYFVSVVT